MKNELQKKFDLSGKTVLLTGASGFFGRYISEAFLAAGGAVVMLGRSEKLKEIEGNFVKKYGKAKVSAYQVDFYDLPKFKKVLHEVTRRHKIDILINNAFDFSTKTGFNAPDGRLEESTYEQWLAAFESGIYWAVLTTQIVGGQMMARKSGSIINISTMYAQVAPSPELYRGTTKFNPPSYGAVKAGLSALTRYTASFWAEYNIRANTISPGPFSNLETITANSVAAQDPFLSRLRYRTLLGRTGHPRDLLGTLIFLASDASSYMTGQNIAIDGGWTVI